MKVKVFHESLEYAEGFEDQIFSVRGKSAKYGFEEDQFFMLVTGKMEVCPSCGGTGSHVRRDIDDSKLVDMMREDGDYEGIEGYFAGDYDVTCETCRGANVVTSPDWDQVDPKLIAIMSDWDQCARETQAEQDAERAMGA